MEGQCSTGQSALQAVEPMEEEEVVVPYDDHVRQKHVVQLDIK